MAHSLSRRAFFAASSFLGLASSRLLAREGEAKAPLDSDFGILKRVIVLTPRAGDHEPIPEFGDQPDKAVDGDDLLRLSQHKQFVDLIQGNGAKALHLDKLLDTAIAQCRRTERFHGWIAHNAPWLAGQEDEVDGKQLIETAATTIDPLADDMPQAFAPVRSMFFTRDIAAMTPKGLVLANFANDDRMPEVGLLRFALQWAPQLRDERVVFDAQKAGVNLQGGDLIVADEKTLYLGVGNLTDSSAAAKLARTLKMDVVAVSLPGMRSRRGNSVTLEGWNGLRTRFLHLDTVLSFLGPKRCLTLPYVFESAYQDRDNVRAMATAFHGLDADDDSSPGHFARVLADVGRVRVYRAGTGESDRERSGKKLVDHLRASGYEPVFVGGKAPKPLDVDHLRERVIPELENQAANVVMLKPGRAVAYSGNSHTLNELREAGVSVDAFAANSLSRWHGGPHCLTMPLERERVSS